MKKELKSTRISPFHRIVSPHTPPTGLPLELKTRQSSYSVCLSDSDRGRLMAWDFEIPSHKML